MRGNIYVQVLCHSDSSPNVATMAALTIARTVQNRKSRVGRKLCRVIFNTDSGHAHKGANRGKLNEDEVDEERSLDDYAE